jgi:hypothetical protein
VALVAATHKSIRCWRGLWLCVMYSTIHSVAHPCLSPTPVVWKFCVYFHFQDLIALLPQRRARLALFCTLQWEGVSFALEFFVRFQMFWFADEIPPEQPPPPFLCRNRTRNACRRIDHAAIMEQAQSLTSDNAGTRT